MNVPVFLSLLFGCIILPVLIVFLISKFQDKKIEENRKWREIKDVWLDENSGEIKIYLNDDETYKFT